VEACISKGLYLDARRALAGLPSSPERLVIEAEIGWILGEFHHALSLLNDSHSQPADKVTRIRGLMVEGGILAESGNPSQGIARLSAGISLARSVGLQSQIARLETRLLTITEDRLLPDVVDAECDRVRSEVVKAGRPELSISLHCIRGRVLAKRGALDLARRHFDIAAELLYSHSNPLLEGTWRLDMSVLSWMCGDLRASLEHAGRAMTLSGVSGHARTRTGALGNIGLLRFFCGNPRGAESDLASALTAAEGLSLRPAFLESLAQIRLSEGELDECQDLIRQADTAFAQDPGKVKSWYDLAAYPTRIALALRQRRPAAALRLVGEATASAESRNDALLGTQLLLLRAESLLTLGRLEEAGAALSETLHKSADMPLNTLGELERIHGKYLAAQHAPAAAVEHFDRAIRVFLTTGHVAARLDTVANRNEIVPTLPTTAADPPEGSPALPALDAGWASHLVEMAGHPELLGREAFALLERSRGMHWTVLSANSGANQDILLSAGLPPRSVLSPQRHTVSLVVGRSRDREIVLTFEPRHTFAAEQVVWSVRRLVDTAMSVEAAKRSQRQRASLWPKVASQTSHSPFASDSMREILRAAEQLADTNIPILITGETGTGKEVLAREIHTLSRRGSQPFMPFNCTAVARDMLDSQLFGHRRGAFTGASDHFLGVIRTATGGTLFLDEIGEIGLDVQPKLLRFLESSEVHPLGEGFPQRVDVRVIAATNADVDRMVAEGRFREDLFYRLTPARFRVPPLRERRDEIPALLKYFLAKFSDEYQKPDITLTDEALEFLLLFRWPGNIRQLMHEVRRLVALTSAGHAIEAHLLSSDIRSARPIPVTTPPVTPNRLECVIRLDQPLPRATAQLETLLISNALSDSGGVVEKAAKRLGISRKGLFLKRRRLKL
jgi:DNA-binding NtrC family response regulator/tetratricopeptide (TPR) repeat protein